MIPAVFLFVGMMFLPESPRWLARKDRWEECHSVLTLVHGKGDANSPIVVTEMQEIQDLCEFERQNKDVTYMELFKPTMLNRTMIGMFTQIWSQLTGMNVMSMFVSRFLIECQLTITSVLYYLRFPNGWILRRCQPDCLLDPVHHQRCHDHSSSTLDGPLGSSSDLPYRLRIHDGLDVCQRRYHGIIRHTCPARPKNNSRGIHELERRPRQGSDRMHIPLRRQLRSVLWASIVGLPTRVVPPARAW